ncbi:hypothetical protein ACQPVA_15135 [Clostridium butyricum]|uniref:hypothetical protein n=1 Tax=Clostridium butyricum TaxID=1492 RepID=UPI003D347E1F
MDFKLNIETLEETINKYDKLRNLLEKEKVTINKTISDLEGQGWTGEAKDKFIELHNRHDELYENLLNDVKYMWSALENEEKPRAIQLKMRCEDFINCIKRSSIGIQANANDTGIISLDFCGLNIIRSYIDRITDDYNKILSDDFADIIDTLNTLEFTSFGIGSDIQFVGQTSLKNQNISLKDFEDSFIQYDQGVKNMESNICSVLAKISGITTEITSTGKDSFVLDNGEINVEKIKEILNKDPENLSDEEIQFIEYAIKLMDEDEYKKIKESIDNDKSEENLDFMTLYLKKLLPAKISQGEKVVISGNYDGSHAQRNFLETAIKQIKDWQAEDNKDITWIVTNSGYSDADIERIKEAAEKYNVHLMLIYNADEIINYLNTGKDADGNIIENRVLTKISDVSVFSHGVRDGGDTLALDYHSDSDNINNPTNINIQDLENTNINKDNFNDTYTYFAACNLGTIQDGKSFASEWVKKVGGEAEAICDPTPDSDGGQTEYADINKNRGLEWRTSDWIRRTLLNKMFDIDGCINYPIASETDKNKDIYWTKILDEREVEKIEGQGGPR